jgi:DNA-directed RNA polymerase specialized sigma24 family protein
MTPPDEELLERTLQGDEDAFTALYRLRQAAVYRSALHMSGSAAIADVMREAFLR